MANRSILALPSTIRRLILEQQPQVLSRSTPWFATATRSRNLLQPRRAHTSTPTPPQSEQIAPDGNVKSSSSVDASEVSHFSALASDWWDPQGSSRLLHLMNPLRHRFIQRCTNRKPIPNASSSEPKLKFLDVGCGGGIFAESAARLPFTHSVTAIDPTEEVIKIARQHQRTDPLLLEPGRLEYRNMAIEDLPVAPDEHGHDIITLFEVLEHIRSPAPFLSTVMPHLKPGGWIFGSTIARSRISWLTTKLVAEDVLRIVPRGTHQWAQYINPDELEGWVRKQHYLCDWRVQGVVYLPGLGWKEIDGSEGWGNYFFAFRKRVEI